MIKINKAQMIKIYFLSVSAFLNLTEKTKKKNQVKLWNQTRFTKNTSQISSKTFS